MTTHNEELKQHLLTYKQRKHPLLLSVFETYLCGCFHTYTKVAAQLRKQCVECGFISAKKDGTFVINI